MLKIIFIGAICLLLLFSFSNLTLYAQTGNTQQTQDTKQETTATTTTTTTTPETTEIKRVTLDDVTKKQNEMFAFVDEYNEIVKKGKAATSFQEKKKLMEQAQAVDAKIKEAQTVYSDVLKQYNKWIEEERKRLENPEAVSLFKELKSLEAQVNKKAAEHNDLLNKLQKAQEVSNASDVSLISREIEDVRSDLKRLKSEYFNKLSEYKELTKEKPIE